MPISTRQLRKVQIQMESSSTSKDSGPNPSTFSVHHILYFTPTITFEHNPDVHHQNYMTRMSILEKAVVPKAPPIIPQANNKNPIIKQEIKKNDTAKPKPGKKEEKKQQTLFGVGNGGITKQPVQAPPAKVEPVQAKVEQVKQIVEPVQAKVEPVQVQPKVESVPMEQVEAPSKPAIIAQDDVKMKSAEKSPPKSKIEEEPVKADPEDYENEKKDNSGKKRRLKRNITSDVDEPMAPAQQQEVFRRPVASVGGAGKKRPALEDSDDENNELDVGSSVSSAKENTNVFNKQAAAASLAPGKGRKKVKKTKTTFDEKGYMVTEDYSSYEEYDLPVKSAAVKKAPITQTATQGSKLGASGVAKGNNQAGIKNFFKK